MFNVVKSIPAVKKPGRDMTEDLEVKLAFVRRLAETDPGCWAHVSENDLHARSHSLLTQHGCEVRAVRKRDGDGDFIRTENDDFLYDIYARLIVSSEETDVA